MGVAERLHRDGWEPFDYLRVSSHIKILVDFMVKKVLKWTAAVVVCFFGVIVAIAIFVPTPTPSSAEATAEAISQSASTTAVVATMVQASSSAAVVADSKIIAKPPTTSSALPQSQYGVRTKTTGCIANQELPDPACSPGAVLTTDTSIICVSGYTQTVRDVPTSEKEQVFAEYGIDYSLHSGYEVDHIISLELGGSNDISNLYPESYSIHYGARIKDTFENYLHGQVCNGKMSITVAQQEIATDWLKYYLVWQQSSAPSQPVPPATISTSGHTFYLSTYYSSKYYYCDTDDGWKSLSTKYLKSYSTEQALLAAYPNRIPHEACKN